jgi:hypothetical protein
MEHSAKAGDFAADFDRPAYIFSDGLKLLTRAGHLEKDARKILGKLRSLHGDEDVADAIRTGIDIDASEPVAYLNKILQNRKAIKKKVVVGRNDPAVMAAAIAAYDAGRIVCGICQAEDCIRDHTFDGFTAAQNRAAHHGEAIGNGHV